MDAVVEAHLHSFNSVMTENLQKNNTEANKTNE
jgi:hypothetical protein